MDKFSIIFKIEDRTLIMGILNITPDSFFDGGRYLDIEKAYECAQKLVNEGADIIDIGGESSRPGSKGISITEELDRILPVLNKLKGKVAIPISVDTTKAVVAKEALKAGANIINDISALNDPEMIEVILDNNIPVIIMHMKGTPRNMQVNPYYFDVIKEIKGFFKDKIEWMTKKGIHANNIIIDPGIGFGKRLEDNLDILNNMAKFKEFNLPILIGPSRKSFIGTILDEEPKNRLSGTLASVAIATANGVDIIRVHDVREAKQVVKVVNAIKNRDQIVVEK